MTLYFIGMINGILIVSFGIMSYKGYEIYNKQLLLKDELDKMEKNFNKFLNEKFIMYNELN